MKKFVGILRFVYVVFAILLFSLKGHIAGFFTDKEKFYRRRIGPSGFVIIRRLGITVDMECLNELDPDKNYILMGNHRSYTDILVVFLAMAVARRDVIFMSKKEIFKVPLLGGAMKALGMIGVERRDTADAFKSLVKAVKSAKKGANIVIFPEGTRSATRELLPLKRGGFVLAVRAGLDIAPFVIRGSEKCMPKSGFAIYPGHISIKFLPIVPIAGLTDRQALSKVEETLKNALEGDHPSYR